MNDWFTLQMLILNIYLIMSRPKVFLFRAGAPDKAHRFTSGNYDLILRDGVNLRDYSLEQLQKLGPDSWVLSADEDDIAYANKLPKEIQDKIMLTKTNEGIIKHSEFIPKDAPFYSHAWEYGFIYPDYKVYNPLLKEDLDQFHEDTTNRDKFVVKVADSSGSRGVYVIDSEREIDPMAREQYHKFTKEMAKAAVELALERHSNIIVQDLSYKYAPNMTFFGINMIIRHGKLVISKLEVAEETPSTNFDHGHQIRNEWTDEVTNRFVKWFTDMGITDGFLGIDCCTDFKDIVAINEVNFRMENCFFSTEVFGVDCIDAYLFPENYSMDMVPFGDTRFVRYWRAMKFEKQDYQGGLS